MYKIVCKDETILDCYVGHTTNFKQRQIEHKYACCNENSKSHNILVYTFIRANGGYDNFTFIQIEEYPCENKKQAHSRENYWVFELKATLNAIMPILNIENIRQRQKNKSEEQKQITIQKLQLKKEAREKYLEDNKEQILQHKLEVRRLYDEKNREQINAYMREYNKLNSDTLKERSKIYYEKRKARGYYNKD